MHGGFAMITAAFRWCADCASFSHFARQNLTASLSYLACFWFLMVGTIWAQEPIVSGVVRDAVTGSPIEGSTVSLFSSDGVSSVLTAEDGSYQVAAPPGVTKVRVAVEEFEPYVRQEYPGINTGEIGQAEEIDLAGGDVIDIDFDLVRGYVISGAAIDSAGEQIRSVSASFIRDFDNRRLFVGGRTDGQGNFSSPRMAPGDYKVLLQSFGTFDQPPRYIDQLYPDVQCIQGRCDTSNLGEVISLNEVDVALEDVTMSAGSVMIGTVIDAATGDPVADGEVTVLIYSEVGELIASLRIFDPDPELGGRFVGPPLPSGTYKILFTSSVYLSQFFGEPDACAQNCDPSINGSLITLDGTADFTADISLQQGFSISGRIFDQADETVAVTTSCRTLYTAEGEFVLNRCGSDEGGEFAIGGLPPGSYKLAIDPYADSSEFLRTLYDGVSCGFGGCPVADQGTLIDIVDQDVSLDIAVARGGILSGSMVDAATNVGLDGFIELLTSNGDFGLGVFNITDGVVETGGLPPGTYKAVFRSDGYIDQLYSGVACPNFSCDRSQLGDTFEVVSEQTTALDQVRMAAGAAIQGTLTGSDGAIVQQAWVRLYDSLGNPVVARRVDENGFFRIEGLPAAPAGGYRLKAQPDADYLEQLYSGRDCITFCPPAEGEPIELDAGETVTIDMTLQRAYSITVNAFDRDAPEVPIETACVDAYTSDGQYVTGRCYQNAGGVFKVPGLLPGDYKVRLNPYGDSVRYAITLYDGITCLPGCNLSQEGTIVSLGEASLELSLPVESVSLISGVITDAEANPLRDVSIAARPVANPNELLFLGTAFAEDGSYALRIPDGEFYIEFWPFGLSSRYVRQVFPDIPCTPLGCERDAATSFLVQGENIEVNTTLQLGARVAGSIARSDGGEISAANIFLFTRDRDGGWGLFGGSGSYNYAAVPPGEYWLAVRSFETNPVLIDQLYEAKACPWLNCDFEQTGDVLILQEGDDLQIDFALEIAPTQTVTGTVLERNTGLPLAGAQVDVIWNNFRVPLRTVQTDTSGQFSFELPAGDFGLLIERPGYITRGFGSFIAPIEGWCSARRCLDFPGQRFTVGDQPVNLGDLPMDPGALITGTLSLPEGTPVEASQNARLRVFDENGRPINGLQTRLNPWFAQDAPGEFAIEVPPGRWHMLFQTSNFNRSLVATALGDLPCPEGSCGMETTVSVEVAQGQLLTPNEAPQLAVTMSDGIPLTGSLIDGDNVIGLDRGSVFFYNDQGAYVGGASLNSQGIFQTAFGLPDGIHYASTAFLNPGGTNFSGVAAEFVDVLYDGLPCVSDCDVTSGTPIDVELQAGTLPPPVDITLFRGVSISGSVLQAEDSTPVPAQIEVFDATGRPVPGALVSQEDGSFTVGGLLPGDYYLRTRNFSGLEDQLWNGAAPILCAPSCSPLTGTPISVTSGDSVEGINFALSGASSISGTTNGTDDTPLEAITVEIYNALGVLVGSALSDQNGAWAVDGLPAGQFYVRTRNQLGLVNVAWNGLECTGCDVTQTTAIELGRGEARLGIDLALDTGATLTGTVTREADGTSVAGVNIDVYSAAGVLLASTQTGSNGSWQVDGLGEGSYRIATRSSLGLVNQVHAGVDCVAGCDIASGSVVTLAIGQTVTINFALKSAASIAGTVRDAEGAPIADVAVQTFLADGRLVRQGRTAADGSYEIRGLAPGEVFLRTRADGNYTDQTFNGRDCIPVCDVTGSDAVTVTAGARREGIDFSLTFGGGLAGSVTTLDEAPVSSLSVEIYNAVGSLVGTPRTDASGQFILRGLPGGRYFARTRNSRGLIDQVFDGFGCTPFPCVTGLGTPLVLGGGLIEGVGFTLAAGSELQGNVTDQFGNPLPTGEVVLFDERAREVKRGLIADGQWRLTGIADGTYYAVVLNGSGLIDELYERKPCPGGRCDVTEGTAIIVGDPAASPESVASRSVPDRNGRAAGDGPLEFTLQRGSRIRGLVQDPIGSSLANVRVSFFNDRGALIGSTRTDALGEFVSESAFSPGDYYIATTDGETRGVTVGGYVNVVYNGDEALACPLECDVTEGSRINLDGQFDGDGIVLRVLVGAALTGKAVDNLGNGLVGAVVEVFDTDGRLAGQATVGTSGVWSVDGLPDADYTVVLRNDLVQAFDDYLVGPGFCSGECDPSAGTVFTIRNGEPDSEVDIILAREDVIFQSRFQ